MKTHAILALAILTISAQAKTVNETFDGPLAKNAWNFLGSPATSEGTLTLTTGEGNESAYIDSGLVAKEGNPSLDFVQEPIEVELTDLTFGGSAEPQNRLFMLIIAADSPKETTATSYVKLRLSADGRAIVLAGGGGAAEKEILSTQVSYPVKKLTLKLTGEKAALAVESAGGNEKATGDLQGLIEPSAWGSANPFLVLKAVRRPGPGVTKVTIDGVKISAAH